MFRFQEPSYFIWLLLSIPLGGLFFQFLKWRVAVLSKIGDSTLTKRLVSTFSEQYHRYRLYAVLGILGFSVIGLANPQFGNQKEKINRRGIDIVLALDISQSMWATDASPNRLNKAKTFINRLIDKLKGDRIALVVFAGDAFLELPLTSDYASAKLFLKSLSPDITSAQGTAIDKAIETGLDAFDKKNKKSSVMLIISDGENHEGGAEEMAQEAANQGVRIFTIGVGTTQGANLPLMENGVQMGFKMDNNGNAVISKLNPEMLSEIALKGNGKYTHLDNEIADAKRFLNELDKIEKKDFQEVELAQYKSYFWFFVVVAFAILCWESFRQQK